MNIWAVYNVDASNVQDCHGLEPTWRGKTWEDHAYRIRLDYVEKGFINLSAPIQIHTWAGRENTDFHKMVMHAPEQRRESPDRPWFYDGFAEAMCESFPDVYRKRAYVGNIYPHLINPNQSNDYTPEVTRRVLASLIPVVRAGFTDLMIDASNTAVPGLLTDSVLWAVNAAGMRAGVEGPPFMPALMGYDYSVSYSQLGYFQNIKSGRTGEGTVYLDLPPPGERWATMDSWLRKWIKSIFDMGLDVGIYTSTLNYTTKKSIVPFVP